MTASKGIRKTRGRTEQTLESLMARTEEEGDCLMWTGFMQGGKVPMVSHKGRMVSVRKLVHYLSGKRTHSGGYWHTRCGCKECVAPDHIVWLSSVQNARRMNELLFADPVKLAVRNAKLGAHHRRLTDEQITEVRNSSESHVAMAARMGVSVQTIKKYRSGIVGATLKHNPWLQLLRLGGVA